MTAFSGSGVQSTNQPGTEPIPWDAPNGLGAIDALLAEHSAERDHALAFDAAVGGWYCQDCFPTDSVGLGVAYE